MNYASQKHFSLFIRRYISGLLFWFVCTVCHATPSETDLVVWVSEAIVTTYTFSADNFLDRQKTIAKYFTSQGWINFTKAIQASKLQESVEKVIMLFPLCPYYPRPSNFYLQLMNGKQRCPC